MKTVNIRVIPAGELTEGHLARWSEIQSENPALGSPYFCPEFTQAVADVRDDVYVALLKGSNDVTAFLPYQRSGVGMASPVGGQLSDFHGLIAPTGFQCDPVQLLRACGLPGLSFHHMLASQQCFAPYHHAVDGSHYIDLAGGFADYEAALKAAGSHLMKDFRAKCRKLEREFGPVHFEPHCKDPAVLEMLFDWKSRQYRGAGLIDVFSFDWTRSLLRRIHATETSGFAGMLSVLRVGGKIAAIHMGMRSHRVWNWWFPRHEEQFSRGSPGLVLRLFAAKSAAEMGLVRMDLGFGGDDTYKPRLSTGTIPLASGRIARPSVTVAFQRLLESAEEWIRRSPLMPVARIPGRWIKRAQRRLRFQ